LALGLVAAGAGRTNGLGRWPELVGLFFTVYLCGVGGWLSGKRGGSWR
jgi:hypothetical protein